MSFNIVLVHPEIPNNTGNIGRLCVATGSKLHLIEPLGFSFEDKYLRRSGLDYWKHLEYKVYPNFDAFLEQCQPESIALFTAHANSNFWDYSFKQEHYLVYGCESVGLPQHILDKFPKNTVGIPQYSDKVRCLNIANAVSVSLYEAIRQTTL